MLKAFWLIQKPYYILITAECIDKPCNIIDAKIQEMFEHVVFHGAVEEQENIQTKGVINFGGGKSQKKRKYESSHCKHKEGLGLQ